MIARVFKAYSGVWYAYDGNTNAVVKLDRVTSALIRSKAWPDGGRNLQRLKRLYGDRAVDDRRGALERIRSERGVFQPSQIRGFRRPARKEDLADAFRHGLSHAVLVLTERCNLRCSYCLYSERYPEYRAPSDAIMSWSVARAAIDLLLDNSGDSSPLHLGFYGGEPLLELKLIERCVSYARARCKGRQLDSHVTTNGTMLTPDAIRFLASHDFYVTVSLDGPQAVHDKSRIFEDGRGTWTKVMDGLARIRTLDPDYFDRRVSLNCVVSSDSALGEVIRFFHGNQTSASDIDVTINGLRIGESRAVPDGDGAHGGEDGDLAALRREFIDAVVAGVLPVAAAFCVLSSCRVSTASTAGERWRMSRTLPRRWVNASPVPKSSRFIPMAVFTPASTCRAACLSATYGMALTPNEPAKSWNNSANRWAPIAVSVGPFVFAARVWSTRAAAGATAILRPPSAAASAPC